MAAPKAKDPLEALQLLVNDVLVQTGKALRASRRDSQDNLPPSQTLQAKLPDTIKSFHSALDDLENDIIRAKSVLLRDLDELKAQRHHAEVPQSPVQPQPVESQSKTPMAIEIESSPQPALKEEPLDNDFKMNRPAAPFPDMGMGTGLNISDANQSPAAAKESILSQASPTAQGDGSGATKSEGEQSHAAAPVPVMDAKTETGQPDIALDLTNADLNFTDMEFTLAPANDNQTQQGGEEAEVSNEPPLDLASFGAADGSSINMASLDNIIPPPSTEQSAPNTDMTQSAVPNVQTTAEGEKTGDAAVPDFDQMFAGDGQADGMDFDFSLGDGNMGGDTFDDLMNDRDNTFDTMEHGEFDASFFGLDKVDG